MMSDNILEEERENYKKEMVGTRKGILKLESGLGGFGLSREVSSL